MMSHEGFAEALRDRHTQITEPTTFRLLGEEWDLLPGVYAPHLTPCAALYAEWVPFPVGGSLCDLGCGTGYLAVLAAGAGCRQVVALDVAPEAVDNAGRNARRFGVEDRVEVRCGDLFAPLAAGETFDVVFWNSNFVETDEESDHALDRALFDPGYRTHDAFLATVGDHLGPGGRVFLGFSGLGNRELLERLAGRHGWRTVTRRCALGRYPDGELRFELLELVEDGATDPSR